jgi:hypothetical protein
VKYSWRECFNPYDKVKKKSSEKPEATPEGYPGSRLWVGLVLNLSAFATIFAVERLKFASLRERFLRWH